MLTQGGMGVTSLEWGEIRSWAELFHSDTYIEWCDNPETTADVVLPPSAIPVKQITLTDWELQQVKRLSEEYCSEYHAATEPSRPCPRDIFIEDVSDEVAMENAKAMAQGFRDLFGKGSVSAQNK